MLGLFDLLFMRNLKQKQEEIQASQVKSRTVQMALAAAMTFVIWKAAK